MHHLNPLQETVQPEGENDWRGVRDAIAQLVRTDTAPVIVKEVGAGISVQVAKELFGCGVMAVDIAGLAAQIGARIEAARAGIMTPIFLSRFWIEAYQHLTVCLTCVGYFQANILLRQVWVNGLDAIRAYWLGAGNDFTCWTITSSASQT